MEKNEEIMEMTPEELADYINRQDENTIISITIASGEEGGNHVGRENV